MSATVRGRALRVITNPGAWGGSSVQNDELRELVEVVAVSNGHGTQIPDVGNLGRIPESRHAGDSLQCGRAEPR